MLSMEILAPGNGKIFLWLAMRDKCWMSYRLAKRGNPHPEQCVLCDHEEENIQHIRTNSVLAFKFWTQIFTHIC